MEFFLVGTAGRGENTRIWCFAFAFLFLFFFLENRGPNYKLVKASMGPNDAVQVSRFLRKCNGKRGSGSSMRRQERKEERESHCASHIPHPREAFPCGNGASRIHVVELISTGLAWFVRVLSGEDPLVSALGGGQLVSVWRNCSYIVVTGLGRTAVEALSFWGPRMARQPL